MTVIVMLGHWERSAAQADIGEGRWWRGGAIWLLAGMTVIAEARETACRHLPHLGFDR